MQFCINCDHLPHTPSEATAVASDTVCSKSHPELIQIKFIGCGAKSSLSKHSMNKLSDKREREYNQSMIEVCSMFPLTEGSYELGRKYITHYRSNLGRIRSGYCNFALNGNPSRHTDAQNIRLEHKLIYRRMSLARIIKHLGLRPDAVWHEL